MTPKSTTLMVVKSGLCSFNGVFGFGFCLVLMGRRAMEVKLRRDKGGLDIKGGWLKEKRMSLKLPSHRR